MEKQITIATFDELSMAYIARSKLEASGIPCFLTNEYLAGMNRLYSGVVQGIDLKVQESDAAVACELLTGKLLPMDLAPEDRALAPDLETALFEPEWACPRCGSADVSLASWPRLLAALSYLAIGVPLRWRSRSCRCGVCGHKWKEGRH